MRNLFIYLFEEFNNLSTEHFRFVHIIPFSNFPVVCIMASKHMNKFAKISLKQLIDWFFPTIYGLSPEKKSEYSCSINVPLSFG